LNFTRKVTHDFILKIYIVNNAVRLNKEPSLYMKVAEIYKDSVMDTRVEFH